MAELMFLLVNLWTAGRKLPSQGVYRSAHGIIGLCLAVSWITNNSGVRKMSLTFSSNPTNLIKVFCVGFALKIQYLTQLFTTFGKRGTSIRNPETTHKQCSGGAPPALPQNHVNGGVWGGAWAHPGHCMCIVPGFLCMVKSLENFSFSSKGLLHFFLCQQAASYSLDIEKQWKATKGN